MVNSMTDNKKKKIYLLPIVSFLLYIALGYYAGHTLGESLANYDPIYNLAFFPILFIAIILNVIIHEAGHLVCGLISGYEFSSFRIFSFMIVKDNGKFKVKRFSLAGTGGQCLLVPPEMQNGDYPSVLYNLGGALADLITALIIFFLSIAFSNPWLSSIFKIIAANSLVSAITNGLPMRSKIITNDGYNAWSLRKDANARRALWLQLKINAESTKGRSLKDMPDEWFVLPADDEMKNPLISAIGVFCCNRMMEQHRFEEADQQMRRYINDDVLIGIYKCLAVCDCILCELMGENRRQVIEELLTKEQRKLMKSMRQSISVVRTEYLIAKIIEMDEKKADKLMRVFEKTAKNYPFPQDIETERELISMAVKASEKGYTND